MNSLEYATLKHKGQKRKDGKDYITHPIAVSEYASVYAIEIWKDFLKAWPTDHDYFANLLLGGDFDLHEDYNDLDVLERLFMKVVDDASKTHDTVEDTDATLDEIEELFGSVVRHAVDALTKRPGENYFDALMRVRDNPIAVIVKRADLTHNLSDLNEGSLKDKYRLAKYILEHNY